MNELIEALAILGRHTGDEYPTTCEDELLIVHAAPSEVCDADKSRLAVLGFDPDEERGCFTSVRFGSRGY